jgi:DNA-binding transcriptional MerR regulator
MIKIGLFAMIGQVSIESLRHYDRQGLLKPSQVDAFTGYRYYALDQLPRLHRILALKELGLSLEQIALLLDGEVSVTQVRAMLQSRLAQLQQTQAETAAQLALLRARLIALNTEDKLMMQEVLIKMTEPVLVAGRRFILKENPGTVGDTVVIEDLSSAFEESARFIGERGGQRAGPAIALWYTPPTQMADEDVEAAFPLRESIADGERVRVHPLPAERVAAIMHTGDFRQFSQSVRALVQWIEDNGYRMNGALREIYHKFDPANIKDVLVEVQMPVTNA